MRVLIIDDHQVLAEGLAAVLGEQGAEVAVVAGEEARNLSVILQRVEAVDPPVVLLDAASGPGPADLGHIEALARRGAAVIVVSGDANDVDAALCLERGAACVLRKSLSVDELVSVIARAAGGGPLVMAEERARLAAGLAHHREERKRRFAGFQRLTRQERSTLAALMAGQTANDIARTRLVSVATVRTQIASIRKKLGVSTQLAAVSLALRAGWQPDHEPPAGNGPWYGDRRVAPRP